MFYSNSKEILNLVDIVNNYIDVVKCLDND